MALIFMEGWDKYGGVNSNGNTPAALIQAGDWNAAFAVTIVNPLSAIGQAVFMTGGGSLTKTLPGSYGRLIGGIRFSSNLINPGWGIQFLDGGSNQCGFVLNVAGTFSFRNGVYNSGTLLGTSSLSISANSVHYLEWDITFSNTGSFQLFLDGASILSGSGDTTATANNTVSGFTINSGSATVTFDDLYVFDTSGTTNNAVLLTAPRVETQFPVSDGAVQFTLGPVALGSSVSRTNASAGGSANTLSLRRYQAPANCTVSTINTTPAGTAAGAQFRGVVYADSSGVPGTLLASGPTQTGATLNIPRTMPLTTPLNLTAGTFYWLGYQTDTSLSLYSEDDSSQGYRTSVTFSSGAPATAPAGGTGTSSFLIWGTLSAFSGSHAQVVGQTPPQGAQSYLYDATAGHEDLFNYPALSTPPSAIYGTATKASVSKSDAGAKLLSLRCKSGATDSAGSGGTALAPGTSYQWMASYFPTDPATGSAWTLTGLNAAQGGIKVEA